MSDPLSAFGRAEAYDVYAQTQRHVAEALAGRIAALPLPAAPRVLEIGCGTGFLTAALRPRIGGDWTVTDLAPEMLARCRARIGEGQGLRYRVLDGERPDLSERGFDLICSSLAFQWFADLPVALQRLAALLAPGGRIAFATMAEDSFAEWRAAFAAMGLAPATPDYPSIARLASLPGAVVAEEHIVERHPDARAFLAALRGIGAQSPRAGYRPLAAAELRRVMAAFEVGGARVTYHVAYGVVTGDGSAAAHPPRNGEGDRPQGGGEAAPHILGTSNAMMRRGRVLRRNLSPPETRLWAILRQRPEGLKFRRQHPFGPYVLDFYCGDARLAIEIDGSTHDNEPAQARDISRDAWCAERGVRTMRLAAADVMKDAAAVADSIVRVALAGGRRPLHRPSDGPPPRSGEDER